jgi:hypothetical protein
MLVGKLRDKTKPVVVNDIKRFLFSVDSEDKNIVSMVPVFVVYGTQDNEPIYGVLNLIDYKKVFSTMYIGQIIDQVSNTLIINPISSITLDSKYKLEGSFPKFIFLTKGKVLGKEYYRFRDIEIDQLKVKVNPTKAIQPEDDIYRYNPDNLIESEGISSQVVNLNERTFSLTFDPNSYWYVKRWEDYCDQNGCGGRLTSDMPLRRSYENDITVQVCIIFKKADFLPSDYQKEICDPNIYTYELPIPDFVKNAENGGG